MCGSWEGLREGRHRATGNNCPGLSEIYCNFVFGGKRPPHLLAGLRGCGRHAEAACADSYVGLPSYIAENCCPRSPVGPGDVKDKDQTSRRTKSEFWLPVLYTQPAILLSHTHTHTHTDNIVITIVCTLLNPISFFLSFSLLPHPSLRENYSVYLLILFILGFTF